MGIVAAVAQFLLSNWDMRSFYLVLALKWSWKILKVNLQVRLCNVVIIFGWLDRTPGRTSKGSSSTCLKISGYFVGGGAVSCVIWQLVDLSGCFKSRTVQIFLLPRCARETLLNVIKVISPPRQHSWVLNHLQPRINHENCWYTRGMIYIFSFFQVSKAEVTIFTSHGEAQDRQRREASRATSIWLCIDGDNS